LCVAYPLFVYVLIFETSDLTISHDFRDTGTRKQGN